MEQNNEVERDDMQTASTSSKHDFLSLSREDLIDLIFNLETELEAREIAFNVLKLKFSRRDISLYYGCLEALQCDSFLLKYNKDVEKKNSKDIKLFYENQKISLEKVFSAKNKAALVQKSHLQDLQQQYQKICQDLSAGKDQQLHLINKFSKYQENSEKENKVLREELDKVSLERNELLVKVQWLEEELEITRKRYNLHKDGAMLLIRDRSWLARKISHLVGTIDRLENSVETKEAELLERKTELEKVRSRCETDRTTLLKNEEDSNSEFGRIIKQKDGEISKLREELGRLKATNLPSSGVSKISGNLQTGLLLSNGTKKVDARSECKSIYDNVDQFDEAAGNYGADDVGKVWLPQERRSEEESSRMSPFSDAATIKRGTFLKPSISHDFSGFDIFGREMADLQELLVSMASPLNDSIDSKDQSKLSFGDKSIKSEQSSSRQIDAKTFALSVQTLISNGNAPKLKELLQQQGPSHFQHKLPVGVLPLHYAVECCSEACLRVLLENGFDANIQNEEKLSALHTAASEGSLDCLKILLEFGGSVCLMNHVGMTPLHCAAASGHVDCCILLLRSGARLEALNLNNWTALHVCTFSGHSQCLKAILTFRTFDKSKDEAYEAIVGEIFNMADKDGCTLAYLAVARDSKDCLEVLSQCCVLDVQRRDKWNRSILDVASQACLSFLFRSESTQEITCCIAVDISSDSNSGRSLSNISDASFFKSGPSNSSLSSPMKGGLLSSKTEKKSFAIGSMTVSKITNWAEVEEKLGTAFLNHISEISIGLRTKKISRSEQESPDTPNPFTLGITVKSIKYFSIGRYHWSPGTVTEKSPFEMLTTHNTSTISVKLFALDTNDPDNLAYDSLIPIYILQNYLRLVQQYKSVVFYGPKGMGKSHLVRKLAAYIQAQEVASGLASEVSVTNLQSSFTSRDLIKLLINKGCLIDSKQSVPPPTSPILIFDDLTHISVDEVFKDVSSSIENRGSNNKFTFKSDTTRDTSYYMHPNCYIVCTMDRSRSTGLELSIQQRFKWVQMRCDQEPSKYLLHRHLLRNLADSHQGCIPLPDNSVYKAVEWLICVWQRLNDGIIKLGLLDLVFGPCYFLPCPIEKNKPKAVLRWLISLWNQAIAPCISDAVIKSSGSVLPKEGNGQQKVASTALYVLMQRAVVSGCPLAGQERDRYLACFHGSNELDIKVRGEKRDAPNRPCLDSPTPKYRFRAMEAESAVSSSIEASKDSPASIARSMTPVSKPSIPLMAVGQHPNESSGSLKQHPS